MCVCLEAGWVILEDVVWCSTASCLLNGSLSAFLHWLQNKPCSRLTCSVRPPLFAQTPPPTTTPPFISYQSMGEKKPQNFLILFSPPGLCLLVLQVKLEDIISCNQQNLVHSTSPSHPPFTLTPTMAGGRGTPAVSVRSLPPSCLLHRWGHFHLSSDRGGRTNRRRGEEPLMRTKKRILILRVWDEMERG